MLKNCPECNRDISDKAISCPHCGYILASKGPVEFKNKKSSLFLIIAIIVFVIGLLTPSILYIFPALVIIISCVISLIKRERFWGLSVFLIIGTLYLMSSSSLSTGSFSKTQDEENKAYAMQKMDILKWDWRVDGDGYGRIKGRVKNNGDRLVAYFKITARFYDKSHNVINSEYTNSVQDLSPGEAKEFEIMHKYLREYKEADLTVEEVRLK